MYNKIDDRLFLAVVKAIYKYKSQFGIFVMKKYFDFEFSIHIENSFKNTRANW